MSLSASPTVLVQTIMQSLQAKEIGALARCSKWLLQCANSSFAWSRCPPLFVRTGDSYRLRLPPPSSLLRLLLPHSILWVGRDATKLLALTSAVRAVQLQFNDEWIPPTEELFQHSSLTALHSLTFKAVSSEALHFAPQLSALRTLAFSNAMDYPAAYKPLLSTQLTSLRLRDSCKASCLSLIARIATLTHLDVHSPQLDAAAFREFCDSPLRSTLQRLTLRSLTLRHIQSIEAAAADAERSLAQLEALECLELDHCDLMGSLLLSLRFVPRLHSLMVRDMFGLDGCPAQAVLTALLQSAPAVAVSLVAFPGCRKPALLARLDALQSMFPGRVQIAKQAQ